MVQMILRNLTIFMLLVSLGHPATAQSIDEADRVLEALVEKSAVSKQEDEVRNWLMDHLGRFIKERGWNNRAKLSIDKRGNVRLALGRGPIRAVFVAHMDEVGFEIERIEKDGTLVLRALGGFYSQLWPGRVIYLKTGQRHIPVLMIEALPNRRYRAWSGLKSADEVRKAGLKEGMIGTIRKKYFKLRGPRRMGRAMDDRVGCAAQVLAVHHLDPGKFNGTILFVWSVEEEIGLNGAEYVASTLTTPVVFAIDTFVSGDSPLESDHFAQGFLGKGAVIRAGDHSNIVPAAWVRRVRELAATHAIPLQYGVTGGGNDGSVFVPYGAVDVPLAWPLRYSHSPVDYMDLRDLVALSRLVKVLAEELAH